MVEVLLLLNFMCLLVAVRNVFGCRYQKIEVQRYIIRGLFFSYHTQSRCGQFRTGAAAFRDTCSLSGSPSSALWLSSSNLLPHGHMTAPKPLTILHSRQEERQRPKAEKTFLSSFASL